MQTLDLSQDLPIGNTSNPTSTIFADQFLIPNSDIRRFLVLEDGEIVLDHQRSNVDDGQVYDIWSITKSFMGLFLSRLIESDDNDLTFNTTLGEIFVEDSAWGLITDEEELAFKKNITVLELISMTSGLGDNIAGGGRWDMWNWNVPDVAGRNLAESLNWHTYDKGYKGVYRYHHLNNIPSYIISVTTGMTPMEFVSKEIFPHVGINEDEVAWDANEEGIQTSFTSLRLTARQIAKLSQVYLQRGASAPGKQLVSEEFIDAAFSEFSWEPRFEGYVGINHWMQTCGVTGWCAVGLLGQMSCLSFESGRVVVAQMSNTIFQGHVGRLFFIGRLICPLLDPSVPFDGTPFVPSPSLYALLTPGPSSSSSSIMTTSLVTRTIAIVVVALTSSVLEFLP